MVFDSVIAVRGDSLGEVNFGVDWEGRSQEKGWLREATRTKVVEDMETAALENRVKDFLRL